MAKAGLDEEEVVRLLSIYLEDDGFTLGEMYGAEAVTAVEAMRDLIMARLNTDEQNLSLWSDFEDDPENNGVELVGWLEAFVEADPGFATMLNGYYEEFQESARRTGVSVPEASATVSLDQAPAAMDTNNSDLDDEVINDDTELGEATVMIHSDDEEHPEDGIYLYGSIQGHTQYTGSNLGLEESGREQREKLEAIDEPDMLQVVEGEGMPGLFQQLYDAVDEHPTLSQANKDVITEILREMEAQVARGSKANEELLISDVRQIRRIAPDIVDIMLPGMEGFAEEVRGPLYKVLKKIEKAEAEEEREF
jgi:hypothetical protein